MILLYSQVGELSEEQLDFLVDNLEEDREREWVHLDDLPRPGVGVRERHQLGR